MLLNKSLTERVVFRLRFTFGVIIAVLSIATAVCVGSLYQLKESQQEAISFSVPKLAESQRIVGVLAKIADQSARLRNEDSVDGVINISSSLIDHRREIISMLSNNDPQSENLHQLLSQLEQHLHNIVPLKLEYVQISDYVIHEKSGIVLMKITAEEVVSHLHSH